jgi:hypothetical protein
MQPRPPALDTADVRAMPASRTGCLMSRRVVRRVVMGPWFAIVVVFELKRFGKLSRWFNEKDIRKCIGRGHVKPI